jgi:hypothetical protein
VIARQCTHRSILRLSSHVAEAVCLPSPLTAPEVRMVMLLPSTIRIPGWRYSLRSIGGTIAQRAGDGLAYQGDVPLEDGDGTVNQLDLDAAHF